MRAFFLMRKLGSDFHGCLLAACLIIGCSAPEKNDRTLFTTIAPDQSGITFANNLTFDKDFNIYTYRNYYNGGGVALSLDLEIGENSYDISPDGTLAVIGAADGSVYLVPVPKGKSPLTLSRREFRTRLGSITNLRAVSDPKADTGYRFVVQAFPGWGRFPAW